LKYSGISTAHFILESFEFSTKNKVIIHSEING
jgi:hypothetical protein